MNLLRVQKKFVANIRVTSHSVFKKSNEEIVKFFNNVMFSYDRNSKSNMNQEEKLLLCKIDNYLNRHGSFEDIHQMCDKLKISGNNLHHLYKTIRGKVYVSEMFPNVGELIEKKHLQNKKKIDVLSIDYTHENIAYSVMSAVRDKDKKYTYSISDYGFSPIKVTKKSEIAGKVSKSVFSALYNLPEHVDLVIVSNDKFLNNTVENQLFNSKIYKLVKDAVYTNLFCKYTQNGTARVCSMSSGELSIYGPIPSYDQQMDVLAGDRTGKILMMAYNTSSRGKLIRYNTQRDTRMHMYLHKCMISKDIVHNAIIDPSQSQIEAEGVSMFTEHEQYSEFKEFNDRLRSEVVFSRDFRETYRDLVHPASLAETVLFSFVYLRAVSA